MRRTCAVFITAVCALSSLSYVNGPPLGPTVTKEILCDPGFYLVNTTKDNHEPTCRPCPNRTFTSSANLAERCQPCRIQCSEGLILSNQCSPTRDNKCICPEGYETYDAHDHSPVCTRKTCPPGEGLDDTG